MRNLEIWFNNPERLISDKSCDIVVLTGVLNTLHNKIRSSSVEELLDDAGFSSMIAISGKTFLFEFTLTELDIEEDRIEAHLQYEGIVNLAEDEHEDETK